VRRRRRDNAVSYFKYVECDHLTVVRSSRERIVRLFVYFVDRTPNDGVEFDLYTRARSTRFLAVENGKSQHGGISAVDNRSRSAHGARDN